MHWQQASRSTDTSQLLYTIANVLQQNLTPQRARDLARIFGNATFNAVGLTQTPAGNKLRSAALRSVDSFASMISAPTGRQLVIDGAAGFVKVPLLLLTCSCSEDVNCITSSRALHGCVDVQPLKYATTC